MKKMVRIACPPMDSAQRGEIQRLWPKMVVEEISIGCGQHQGTVGMSDTEAWGIILGVTTFVAFSVIFIGDQVLRLPCQRAIFRRKCQAHDGYCACYVR